MCQYFPATRPHIHLHWRFVLLCCCARCHFIVALDDLNCHGIYDARVLTVHDICLLAIYIYICILFKFVFLWGNELTCEKEGNAVGRIVELKMHRGMRVHAKRKADRQQTTTYLNSYTRWSTAERNEQRERWRVGY